MKNLGLLLIILSAFSCGRYELDFDEEINARNFVVTIDENLTTGTSLGKIEASSSYNRISYSIVSQWPEGAFSLGGEDREGEIIVAEAKHYDYETNPIIEGKVAVYNPENADTINVVLTLRDVEE